MMVSVLTYLRQEPGPADLLRLFGMNEGKRDVKVSLAIHHRLDGTPSPAWCGREILSGMSSQGLLS